MQIILTTETYRDIIDRERVSVEIQDGWRKDAERIRNIGKQL